MTRMLAAGLLAVHGLIHLIGFVVPWGIAQVEGFPYRTSALAGAVALGEPGARLVGVAWLVLAVGFVVAGVATWRREAWAAPLTAALAVASIVICTLGLPESVAGIVVNVAILAALGWIAVARGSTVRVPG
jgi:predicted cation transporter